MKRLTEILDEALEEESFDGDIVVVTNDDSVDPLSLLNEGQWRPSGEKDYWLRKDRENDLCHIHIAHKKHINTKTKQVAWREDGKRKDKKTFDVNFKGMETAKRIARDVLSLDDDFVLESVTEARERSLILENVRSIANTRDVYVFNCKQRVI